MDCPMKFTSIEHKGVVNCVELSQHHWCNNLLATANYFTSEHGKLTHHVNIFRINIQKDEQTGLTVQAQSELLKEFGQDRMTTSIAWSPDTALDAFPLHIELFLGSIDGQVLKLSTDLKSNNKIDLIGKHDKQVNCVAVDYQNGRTVSSTGDDCKCVLWNTEDQTSHIWPLKSPGMEVLFHRQDPTKLAVAERCGIIRFYDVMTFCAFMSIDCRSSPLRSVSWDQTNITDVFALSGTTCHVFDTSESCFPVGSLFSDSNVTGVTQLRQSSSRLIAVSTGKNNHIQIYHLDRQDKVVAECSSTVGSGFSWHLDSNTLVSGGDSKLNVLTVLT